jgi:hypothetical protein
MVGSFTLEILDFRKENYFSRIHPGRCINHIEERPRWPVEHQNGYNTTHPT